MVLAAIVAGFSAVALNNVPNKLGLIIAVFIGIAVGLVAENLSPKNTVEKSLKSAPISDDIPS